ncbi:MAG: hypothetical protein HY917_03805 [Candidatus Diapherotrites archaeon]|nr:hypothetical protein [Candidatus Diapherotrites archaeon]
MNGSSIYKIPDGKLIKISLEHDSGKIQSIRITGDFFLYPENGIELIEKALTHVPLTEPAIISAVNQTVSANSLQPFGIHAHGIATGILKAAGSP